MREPSYEESSRKFTVLAVIGVLALFFAVAYRHMKPLPSKNSPVAEVTAPKPTAVVNPVPAVNLATVNPTVKEALGGLITVAEQGCREPFNDCPLPVMWKNFVLAAIQRNNLTFEQAGVSPAQLDELTHRAELKLASQKLAVLRAKGGAKTPQQLQWLSDICWSVYADDDLLSLDGHPTRAELHALAPKDSGFISGCRW